MRLQSGLANTSLVYLEPRERSWWLQMSFSSAGGGVTALHQIPFYGFETGEREERGKERKERDGGMLEKHPRYNKFRVHAFRYRNA